LFQIHARTLSILIVVLAAVCGAWAQKPAEEHVPGRLLVQNAAGASDAAVQQAIAFHGAKVHHKIDQIRVSVLEVPEPALDAVTQALQRTGLFTFVERDHVAHGAATPNDPDFPSQWHLGKIQAASAWGITTGSASVPIAIIDSGVDPTHPDLQPKLLAGWSFLTGTANTADVLGHGTAVAGAAAAATNNATGVAGVGWANGIMPLVVLDSSDYASYSNIASAINYAADHGVRVISISIGGSSASSTLQSAVDYAWSKGAVVFAAAMNFSSSTPYYPAACTNVVAVSATEPDDTVASFSNYGNWIVLSAPGDNILTTNSGGGYGYWYGTSLATPIAAGVAALVLSANPSLSASALVTLLEQNSDDLGAPGFDPYFGWGRVNAYKAVTAAKNAPAIVYTTPPAVSIATPGPGTTVAGTISIQGTATDNVGVTNIQFYVDGVLTSSTSVSPFSFSWSTTTVTNASHTLTVTAHDAAGNAGSTSVTVSVNNPVINPVADTQPPTANITSPANGSTVSRMTTINVSATDNVGVARVAIYIDGVQVYSGTSAPYTYNWNARKAATGTHTITATAWDAAGNAGYALPVNVTK